MADLIHIRVGKKIREEMGSMIKEGLFSNYAEIAREALRDLIIKYREEMRSSLKKKS